MFRFVAVLMVVGASHGLASAQSTEPDTDNIFCALAHNADGLIALERQSVGGGALTLHIDERAGYRAVQPVS